jgi:hypothetical protein
MAAPDVPLSSVSKGLGNQMTCTMHESRNKKQPAQGSTAYSCTKVVENFRPMRVVIIGAGFSGIYHGIRIPERLRNIDLTIYEKNSGIGGTWYENRYPGCACDVPGKTRQQALAYHD